MSDEMTLQEQAQYALSTLNCSHPNTGMRGLQAVLAQVPAGSLDAKAIETAIDQLEEHADEIAAVKNELANGNFVFEPAEPKIARAKAAFESIGQDSSPVAMIINAGPHPDTMISELKGELERIGPDSPNSETIECVIDRLDKIAGAIAKIQYSLADLDFSFGRLEV